METAIHGRALCARISVGCEWKQLMRNAIGNCARDCAKFVARSFGSADPDFSSLQDQRASIGSLIEALQQNGIEATGIKVDQDEVCRLPEISVLHVLPSHFVVLISWCGPDAVVFDPSVGTRLIDLKDLQRRATGYAVLMRSRSTI